VHCRGPIGRYQAAIHIFVKSLHLCSNIGSVFILYSLLSPPEGTVIDRRCSRPKRARTEENMTALDELVLNQGDHQQGRPKAYPATQNVSQKSLGGDKNKEVGGNTVLLGHSTVPLPFQYSRFPSM